MFISIPELILPPVNNIYKTVNFVDNYLGVKN